MTNQNLMEAQIRQFFDVGDCLCMENGEKFCIVEDKSSKSVIQYENIADGFAIHNPETKEIFLLALDNCLLKSIKEGQRCDCALFDDQCFCFVELKLNVHKKSQATDKLREARAQLGNTIKYIRGVFISQNENFLGYDLEAYAVMRSHVYPKIAAQRNTIFVAFLEEYGVQFYEKNEKTFGTSEQGQ